MKTYDSELVDDVEELLEKVILEEVSSAIWKTFENAFGKLDPQSRALLENHLNGATAQKLSEKTQLPVDEVEKWLKQVKRELKQNLRKNFIARH